MSMIKTLQVPVIVGEGEAQFFIEKDTRISPPSPPVFTVKDIKKWVEVYTAKVIKGKVIFNAFLWKTVVYTTVEHVHDGTVNGAVYHSTFKIPFGGFVELCPFPGEKVEEGAKAELLDADIEGSKDIWHDEDCVEGIKVFNKLLEKTVVRLKFKATTIQHVTVATLPKPPYSCDDQMPISKEKSCGDTEDFSEPDEDDE
ncbi:DUF3794 domain-containing protein [Ethanoligenens harbinense]|uniref:SipL SPOCS domain-containing protein n=1 Tax=Ethanoligenens harbinense (strain DSM 18485 / JCM 12961 / CGMCC 1.5033 / YUAN-3) TaxID=663278 RepID=E6U8W0_ETHHY|nr:DUF3794 domain-containing protein [Ethanoligenens harbinense]ADU27195.1 hypothetical protein Ethha_1660 [Ethanoligenens harbinense YUAN-3]